MSFVAMHGLVFVVAFLALAGSALGASEIRDGTGKVVLVVDGDHVKKDGKTVMTIDGDKITNAAGKLVLYINGDNIRDEPNGKLLLMIDGRHLRREIGGDSLLYMDGRNLMRGDRSGSPLLKYSEDIDNKQLMAVLYVVMPEVFGATKEADAAMLAKQAKTAGADDAAAAKDFAPGNYTIDGYAISDTSPNLSGTVSVVKAGDVLVFDIKPKIGEAMQGVGIQQGDEVWVAVGAPATVGLAVYKVAGGNLMGTWYNATGKPESFGSENLSGAAELGGEYKITSAKAPFSQTPYVGMLTLSATGKKFFETAPVYTAAWDLGGYKAKGVGFATKEMLALGTSTGPAFSFIRFKMNTKEGYLNGQFSTSTNAVGVWSLKKAK